jgi:dipeptidase E
MKKLFLASSISKSAKTVAKTLAMPGASLLFIKTASETPDGDPDWLKENRTALVDAGFVLTDYTVTGKTADEVAQAISEHDVIHVSGGNNLYLLQQVQLSGCASAITRAVEQGKPYIGSSAGSQLAAPNLYAAYTPVNAEQAPRLNGYTGLGLVDFIVFPHWGSQAFKEVYFGFRLQHAYETAADKIILLTDNQFVQVEDDMYKVVDC